MYKQDIETEFEDKMREVYLKTKSQTSIRDVLEYMLDSPKIWHFSWELNGKTTPKGGYLSHRACARASDLALHYPELVEDRRVGRFKVYRVKLENMKKVKQFLSDNK